MAVRSFNGTSDFITLGGGSVGAVFNGAFSWVAIVKPTSLGAVEPFVSAISSANGLLSSHADGGVGNLASYSDADDAAAATLFATGSWQITAVTKASGTVAPRFHCKPLGSGSWTQINGGGTMVTQTASVSKFEIGAMPTFNSASPTNFKDAQIAVVALFNVALSDANIQSIQTTPSTQQLKTLGAVALWDLNQASTATSVTDLSGGTANQTALAGTTVVTGDDPTGWTFGISAGGSTVTAVIADGTGTIPVPALAAGAQVVSPIVDGTGTIPPPTASAAASATVTAPAGAGVAPGVVPTVRGGSSVTAPVVDGTGGLVAPTVTGSSNVGAPPVAGTGTIPPLSSIISTVVTIPELTFTGTIPPPTVSTATSANTAAAPAAATGAMVAPSVSSGASASVTAPPLDGSGALAAPTVAAGGLVTSVVADGTGAAVSPTYAAGADVAAVPLAASRVVPAPSVSGSAAGTVVTPALAGTGALNTPLISVSREVTAVPLTGGGDALDASAIADALISAIPAMALGTVGSPIVTGLLYGVYRSTGRAPAGRLVGAPSGRLAVAPNGTLRP